MITIKDNGEVDKENKSPRKGERESKIGGSII
jgi:hypothetical protein